MASPLTPCNRHNSLVRPLMTVWKAVKDEMHGKQMIEMSKEENDMKRRRNCKREKDME